MVSQFLTPYWLASDGFQTVGKVGINLYSWHGSLLIIDKGSYRPNDSWLIAGPFLELHSVPEPKKNKPNVSDGWIRVIHK